MDSSVFEHSRGILVVEDSPADTKMILLALAESARKKMVTTAVNGDQALTLLHKGPRPDLILLDLNLPGKNGWELLAECKADPGLKSIPVVVFTTTQSSEEAKRCYALGANSFVVKPFELNDFMHAVQTMEEYWLGLSKPAS